MKTMRVQSVCVAVMASLVIIVYFVTKADIHFPASRISYMQVIIINVSGIYT